MTLLNLLLASHKSMAHYSVIPMALMLAAQAIPTALNIGKAISQKKKVNDLAKIKRPTYEIPESVKQALNQSRYLAGMRELPGQNTMEARLGENTSKAISQIQNLAANPADLASVVAKLYGNQQAGLQDIGMAAGKNYMNNQAQLSDMLKNYGAYENQAFDYNQNQPYQAAKAAESALREAAYRNLYSAGTNIASGLSGLSNFLPNKVKMPDQYYQDITGKPTGLDPLGKYRTPLPNFGDQINMNRNSMYSNPSVGLGKGMTVSMTPGVLERSFNNNYNQMTPDEQNEFLLYLAKGLPYKKA